MSEELILPLDDEVIEEKRDEQRISDSIQCPDDFDAAHRYLLLDQIRRSDNMSDRLTRIPSGPSLSYPSSYSFGITR